MFCFYTTQILNINFLTDIKPRYVRINSNLLSIANALDILTTEEWRRKDQVPFENYQDYLDAIKSLEEDEFLIDMHLNDMLVFHAKQKHYWACHELVKEKKLMLQDKVHVNS